MSEEKENKEKKVIKDYASSATYFPDSETTIVRHTTVYEDNTVEHREEIVPPPMGKLQTGGVQSKSLYNYLDNSKSKNKEDTNKDSTQSESS